MINEFIFILHLHVSNPSNNPFHRIDIWAGIDEQPIPILVLLVSNRNLNGAWPSGKATGFGPVTRRFESFRPRPILSEQKLCSFL